MAASGRGATTMSTKLWSLVYDSGVVKELMEWQWAKTGVEYSQHVCRWEYRNGCLVPSRGSAVRNRKSAYRVSPRRVMPVAT
jgi:hypothetical protein